MAVLRIVADFHAENPATLARFYETVFGLAPAMDQGWIVTLQSDTDAAPQLSFMQEGGSGAPVPDLSIEVDDLDDVLRRAEAEGVSCEYGPQNEPWGVRRAFIRDPGGRLLNVLMHV